MRALCGLLLLAGCAERALDGVRAPGDLAAPDGAAHCGAGRDCETLGPGTPVTLPGVCQSATGDLEVTGTPVGLRFCHCLHGCGPGIDGGIALEVSNHGLASRQLSLRTVHHQHGQVVFEAPPMPGLQRGYTCPGDAVPWDGRVIAGATEHLVVPQHFDVSAPAPAAYAVRVQLSVDGALRWFELGSFTLAEDPGCP